MCARKFDDLFKNIANTKNTKNIQTVNSLTN